MTTLGSKGVLSLPPAAFGSGIAFYVADGAPPPDKSITDAALVTALGSDFLKLDGSNADQTLDIQAENLINVGQLSIGSTSPGSAELYAFSSSAVLGRLESSGSSNVSFDLFNAAGHWRFQARSSGNFRLRDNVAGTDPFAIEEAAPTNSLYIEVSGNVGIGTAAPEGKLHVHQGDSGAITHPTTAVATFESDDTALVTLYTPDNKTGGFSIGTPTVEEAFQMFWTHGIPEGTLRTVKTGASLILQSGLAATALTLGSDQEVAFAQPVSNHGLIAQAGDPTTTELPNDGDEGMFHNTTSGDRFFARNQTGTIFKALMT